MFCQHGVCKLHNALVAVECIVQQQLAANMLLQDITA
jgi:hypothetical protein